MSAKDAKVCVRFFGRSLTTCNKDGTIPLGAVLLGDESIAGPDRLFVDTRSLLTVLGLAGCQLVGDVPIFKE